MTELDLSRSRRRRLPARSAAILTPLVLSILMTFLVSGVSTLVAFGFSSDLHWHWLRAWGTSWLVAFPALLLALPLVRRIVAALVEPA